MKWLKPVFFLVIIGMIITAGATNKDSFLLKTSHAPFGIISIELNPSNQSQGRILKEWDSVYVNQTLYSRDTVVTSRVYALNTAELQTHADHYFIVFYVLFLSLLYYNNRSSYIHIWILLPILVVIAGILDYVEDYYILAAIEKFNLHKIFPDLAINVFLPSLVKWLILTGTIVYFGYKVNLVLQATNFLRKLSVYSKSAIAFAWKFRIVFVLQAVLFLLLTFSDQGQDLLVTINTSTWGITWFIVVVTIQASLNWFLPKLYDNAGQQNVPMKGIQFVSDVKAKLDFSRWLGVCTFLVPATAILITLQAYHIKYLLDNVPPLLILVIIAGLYAQALRHNWLDVIYKPADKFSIPRYLITLGLILGCVIFWGIAAENRQPYYLAYLSLEFFLLSFAFLITVTYRRCITQIQHISAAPYVLGAGIAVAAIFVAFNFESIVFFFTRNERFYTLPVVLTALVAYTILFSTLLLWGKRIGVQLITILLLITLVISYSTISNFHRVSTVPPSENSKQDSLNVYALNWLKQRRSEIQAFSLKYPGKPYPVFFVNAYGGGIKAAAWTTLVVGQLDQLLAESTAGDTSAHDFQHYVFSYSGASGGTIGLSLLCGARLPRQAQAINDKIFYPANVINVFHHDYLTADVVSIFGRDVLMSSTGFNLYKDRARLMEKTWEMYTRKHGLAYDTLLRQAWHHPKMEVPLFFSNTYDINTGYKGIVSPVLLNQMDFPGTILIQNLLKDQDLRLSTAAFISARFPYVSPTAKFDEKHHFTDGGTIENSGAETSLQVYTVFNRVLNTLIDQKDSVYKNVKLKINFLSLPNSTPDLDSVQRVKNLYEIVAPAFGILNSSNGNTLKADTINRYLARKNGWNYYAMIPSIEKIKTKNVWPVLPLGWQISDYALEQMTISVQRKKSTLDTLLHVFPMYKRKK